MNLIRDFVGHSEGTSPFNIMNCLENWDISYQWHLADMNKAINIMNDKSHILLCGVTMSYLNQGDDIDGKSDDPELNQDRYSSFRGNHWVIIKGISRDGKWAIAYDPNVFGNYPNPRYWYSNGKPKGKDRYYRIDELDKAMVILLEIEGGPGDSISRKFVKNGNIVVSNADGIDLKLKPDFGANTIGMLPSGTMGQVVPDAKNGKYSDGFYWWHVRFNDFEGWCAEDRLEGIQLSTTNFLTISGTVSNLDGSPVPDGYEITIIDETRKLNFTTEIGKEATGSYSITFSNQTDTPIAIEGYYVRVIVKDNGYILGTRTYLLTSEDIVEKNAVIDLKIGNYLLPENLDVNRDGLLNDFDLIQFAINYDKEGHNISGDVNMDGKVDLIDLIRISEYLYNDIPQPSIDNSILIKRVYAVLSNAFEPSKNLAILLSKLEAFLFSTTTKLYPNYPNPCNPGTWIPFRLADQTEVKITIHDVLGRKVRLLELGGLPEGRYTVEGRAAYWDGCNETGERVSSGVYFYTLIADDHAITRRLVVLR